MRGGHWKSAAGEMPIVAGTLLSINQIRLGMRVVLEQGSLARERISCPAGLVSLDMHQVMCVLITARTKLETNTFPSHSLQVHVRCVSLRPCGCCHHNRLAA